MATYEALVRLRIEDKDMKSAVFAIDSNLNDTLSEIELVNIEEVKTCPN